MRIEKQPKEKTIIFQTAIDVNVASPSQCGRNSSGSINITGLENQFEAQPGEFPHMCVIYREQKGYRTFVGKYGQK